MDDASLSKTRWFQASRTAGDDRAGDPGRVFDLHRHDLQELSAARLEKTAIPTSATSPTPSWARRRSTKTRPRKTRRSSFSSPSSRRARSRWPSARSSSAAWATWAITVLDHEIIKAVNDVENAVIRVEACRALGKVGQPEDATMLARIMTVDKLEDCRIAAIEGLGLLKANDPRIYGILLDGMEHDDPAIRLECLRSLRAITGKDFGIDPAAWRRGLEPMLREMSAATSTGGGCRRSSRQRQPRTRPRADAAVVNRSLLEVAGAR